MENQAELTREDLENLRKRFYVYRADMEWTCLEEFVTWAKENGYKKGLHLKKIDASKKHGPGNSRYEDSKAKVLLRTEKHKKFMETRSPYCIGCTKPICPGQGTGGCNGWKEYWIKNWDENIHYVPVVQEVEKPKTSRFWQYEHPDLVREGIVFEHS